MKMCSDVCPQILSVPKTVSFEEQILSKDEYPSIFLNSYGVYCVNYPSNIFCKTCSFENWEIVAADPKPR